LKTKELKLHSSAQKFVMEFGLLDFEKNTQRDHSIGHSGWKGTNKQILAGFITQNLGISTH